MGAIFASIFGYIASNPAVADAAIGLLAKVAPSALSPILSELSGLFLATAPVDPATGVHVPTAAHPQQAVTILQTLINIAQGYLTPGAKPIGVDGVYGNETYTAAKALLAKAGVTI